MEQPDAALAEAVELRDIFGKGNFFLELQDHGLAEQQRINPTIIEISKKTGIPLVCTNDTHYMRRDDSVAHDVLLCIGTGKIVSQPDRMRYETDQFYFKSRRRNEQALGRNSGSHVEHAFGLPSVANSRSRPRKPLPPFDVPPGFNSDSYFEKTYGKAFKNGAGISKLSGTRPAQVSAVRL